MIWTVVWFWWVLRFSGDQGSSDSSSLEASRVSSLSLSLTGFECPAFTCSTFNAFFLSACVNLVSSVHLCNFGRQMLTARPFCCISFLHGRRYISCNPESMVANAIELCTPTSEMPQKGRNNSRGWRNMSSAGLARHRAKSMPNSEPFRPVKAMAVDLFPHTPHCETVMLLERWGGPPRWRAYLSAAPPNAGPEEAAAAAAEVWIPQRFACWIKFCTRYVSELGTWNTASARLDPSIPSEASSAGRLARVPRARRRCWRERRLLSSEGRN